jgi:tetratricopeptide (TPR) repeat protein
MRLFAEGQLAGARELGDGKLMGQALHLLGHLAGAEGDRARAKRLYEESLTWGDFPRRGDALYAVAHQALLDDHYEEALSWLEQAQVVNRAHGDDWALAGDLVGLGYALHAQGRDEEARHAVQQSIALLAPLGEKQVLARSLDALAATLADRDPERAAALLGAAEALREEINVGCGTLSARWNPRTLNVLRHRLSPDSLRQSMERGRAKPEAALELALGSLD